MNLCISFYVCALFFSLFTSLKDLENFIIATTKGLSVTVEEGDYQGLVSVMGRLMAVKEKQAIADAMFEPLKETIELLKVYNQELPDEVHLQLQVTASGPLACTYPIMYMYVVICTM